MNRTGLGWTERSAYHLRLLKRELLDANDAAAHLAVVEAIRTLETLSRSLKAADHVERRRRRNEERKLRERNEANRLLQFRLASVEGKFPATSLPIAA